MNLSGQYPGQLRTEYPRIALSYAGQMSYTDLTCGVGSLDRPVEMSSFTPLVFSTFGGMDGAATIAFRRLASLFAAYRDQPFSTVMAWFRCSISFSLLRSAVTCLQGARRGLTEEAL